MSIRVGVAGVAGMGMFHLLALPKHDDVELTAICDVWPRALESAAAGAPDAQRFTDVGEMCSSGLIDAVFIATPNASHPEAVRTALEAGLHVYCEKPLANTVGECRRIAELARGAGRCVQVGFQHRFQHGYAAAKRLVASGEMGPLHRAEMRATDWFRPNAYYSKRPWRATWEQAGGGVLMMQAIHQLDAFLWITGIPSRVAANAWCGRPDVEIEDDVYAVLEFPGGARGVLCASTLDPAGVNRLEFVFDGGALRAEGEGLDRARWEDPTSRMLAERTNLFEAVPVTWEQVAMSGDATTFDECVSCCQRDFLDAIAQGCDCLVHPAEATRAVEVANAVYLSALTGEPVALPLDEYVYDAAFKRMCAGELRLPSIG